MKHLMTLFLVVLSSSAFAVVDTDKNDRTFIKQTNSGVNTTDSNGSRDIANQADQPTPNSTHRIRRSGYKSGV